MCELRFPDCPEEGCTRQMSYIMMSRESQNRRNHLTKYGYRCPVHRGKKRSLRKGSFWECASKGGSLKIECGN